MTKNNFRNILGIHYGTSGWQNFFSSTPTSLISCRYVEKQSYTILNFFVSLKKTPTYNKRSHAVFEMSVVAWSYEEFSITKTMQVMVT